MALNTDRERYEMRMAKDVGLVFVPLPGMGHLVSMVEFAKQLLRRSSSDHHHRFLITVFAIQPVPPNPQITSYISSVAAAFSSISFVDLPDAEPLDFRNRKPETAVSLFVDSLKPHVASALRSLLSSSPFPIAALVLDLFCTSMIDVANDVGVPPYIFFTSGAALLGLMLYLPTLDSLLPTDKDIDEAPSFTVNIPVFSAPMPLAAMPEPLLHRNDDGYEWYAHHGRRFREAKGIIINTFDELQPYAIKALAEGKYVPDHPTPPVYPVGPLLSLQPKNPDSKHECTRWLDGQPEKSVVFLCFGSMGSFSASQAKEIAAGLERSGYRFLWVLRSPPPPEQRGPRDAVLEEMLPEGFLERIEGRGMVWPTFAPQAEILGHAAVGGFVTHCGWNSCLESLWFGVPMLGWPLYAEQHLNAWEMANEMGVAVGLRIDRKGGNWAAEEEVERGVRCLMGEGGEAVRKKAGEMKAKGRRAVEEGGSSFSSLDKLARNLVQP